jgi:hypothetical protein
VSHTDPMILALLALGETAGMADDAGHTETCARCRAELARLIEVVELARRGPGERLEAPPPQVWDRIAAAAGVSPAGTVPAGNGAVPADNGAAAGNGATVPAGTGAAAPGREPLARRGILARRRLATGLAGLAAGLIIGIGGTAGIVQLTEAPAPRLVAQIELSPLPQFPQWQDATGTAVMRATASQQVIVITLHAPDKSGFYEVWLLARDGVSMISLGDLNAGHTGTFTIPPGVDLRYYSRIDVSLQPFNGSTQHSNTSVVRGSWPAAALGGGGGPGRAR